MFFQVGFHFRFHSATDNNSYSLLLHQNEFNKITVKNGFYYCVYCSHSDLKGWYKFKCTSGGSLCAVEATAAMVEASNKGQGALWHTSDFISGMGSNALQLQTDIDMSPFTPTMDIQSASLDFLALSLNTSLVREKLAVLQAAKLPSFPSSGTGSPRIVTIPQTPFVVEFKHNFGNFPVGTTKGLKFITSDGVFQPLGSIVNSLDPFGPFTWLTLVAFMVASAIVVAAAVAGVSEEQTDGSRLKVFMVMFFWIFRVLTENCHGAGPSTEIKSSKTLCFWKAILVVWLLMGIVISNAYKGEVKSSFFAPTQLKTGWKSVREMRNFSFYTILDDSSSTNSTTAYCSTGPAPVRIVDSEVIANDKMWGMIYVTRIYQEIISRMYTSSNNAATGADDGSLKDEDAAEFLVSFFNKTEFLCKRMLPLAIRTELAKPNTAFFVFSENLPGYYRIFQREMAVNRRKLRYAHNGDIDDGFLKRPRSFAVSGGHEQDQQPVTDRIKILLSSGIYNLWEKWEKIHASRLSLLEQSRAQILQSTPKSLATTDPNIFMSFVGLFLGVVSGAVVLLYENWSVREP